MAETPEISVVIPAYNVAGYIEDSVRSALAQEGVRLEVVIVDDSSTDGTWEAIGRISDPRVRALRLDRNGGPSLARNAGIAVATGNWIAVLDGDDRLLPGRLRRCLDRAAAGGADMVIDNLTISRERDGKSFPMFSDAALRKLETLTLARFIAGNLLFSRGHALGYLKPIFSSRFLKQHGLAYDPDIRIGEDYMIFAQALAKGAVCAVEPTAGYIYTVRAGSISHRLALADIERMAAADRKLWRNHKLDRPARKAQRRRDYNLREAYAYTLLVDALKARSPAAVARAVRHCPTGMRHLWQPVWARLSRSRPRSG